MLAPFLIPFKLRQSDVLMPAAPRALETMDPPAGQFVPAIHLVLP
jgi:hypothetical protein